MIARIDAAQRGIRKTPFAGIEAISLINKDDVVSAFPGFPPKDRLPAIGVSSPLVECQHSRECLGIAHTFEDALRQVIEDFRIDNVPERVRKRGDLWAPLLAGSAFDLRKLN